MKKFCDLTGQWFELSNEGGRIRLFRRECICGRVDYVRKADKEAHCHKCSMNLRKIKGGRKKGGKNRFSTQVKITCEECRKEFLIRRHRVGRARFCSRGCLGKNTYLKCRTAGLGATGRIPWNKKYSDKKECKRVLAAKRRKTIKGKLHGLISSYIWESLKGKKNHQKLYEILGYSMEQLKKHLENQFTEGMTWENHSKYGWHIDHKLPISYFHFERVEDEEFQKCWSLENLQPLWAIENLRKHNKITQTEKEEGHEISKGYVNGTSNER